jgi:hypothetical protein
VTLLSLGVWGGGGELSYPGRRLVNINRFGADGVGRRRSAKKPQTTTLRGVLDATDVFTAALYVATTFPALEGTVQTIVIAGAAHSSFIIEAARVLGRRPIRKAVGGNVPDPKFLLDVEFDVVYGGPG